MEPLKPLNVFWIDDQHEEPPMVNFKVQAEQYGIILHPYTSAEEGLPSLEARLDFFDAVLFDALFFRRKDQVSGTEEVDGLSVAIARVNQLKHRKAFTPFILTGQERLDGDKTFRATFGEFYSKRNPEDVRRLFKDIRLAAETMADTQIRHRYHRVFEVCTDRYIGQAAAEHLLTILRNVNGVEAELKDDLYFNHLRKCLEWLFRAANRQGLLHDKCIAKGEVNLRCSSLFMAGKEVNVLGVKSAKAHFPPLIAEHVRYILDVTNAHSHTESWEQEQARMQLDQYRAAVHSPYLLFGLTFMLLDVLLWFKKYADDHTSIADNRTLWEDLVQPEGLGDEQVGIVIKRPDQGYAFFKPDTGAENAYIKNGFVKDNSLVNAMRVAVRTKLADKGPEVTSLRVIASHQ